MSLPALVLALVAGASVSCDVDRSDKAVPAALCGTKVRPTLSERLLRADDDIEVRNRVDRAHPQPSSWCQVFVDGEEKLSLRFAWHPDAVDPYQIAKSAASVSSISEPVRLNAEYKMSAGNDGAIATAPCKTGAGTYFTLSIALRKVSPIDQTHRNDIEKFMRVYFPATVGTLGCRR
ncbi:hypothetical protein [Streptomyces sp. NPDC004100]